MKSVLVVWPQHKNIYTHRKVYLVIFYGTEVYTQEGVPSSKKNVWQYKMSANKMTTNLIKNLRAGKKREHYT